MDRAWTNPPPNKRREERPTLWRATPRLLSAFQAFATWNVLLVPGAAAPAPGGDSRACCCCRRGVTAANANGAHL